MEDDWANPQENDSFEEIESAGKASQKSHERLEHLKYQTGGGVLDLQRYRMLKEALEEKRRTLSSQYMSEQDIEDCMKGAERRMTDWLHDRTLVQIGAFRKIHEEAWARVRGGTLRSRPALRWADTLGHILGIERKKPVYPTPVPVREAEPVKDDSIIIQQSYSDGIAFHAYSLHRRGEADRIAVNDLPPGEYWREDENGARTGITIICELPGSHAPRQCLLVHLDLKRRLVTEDDIVVACGYVQMDASKMELVIELFLRRTRQKCALAGESPSETQRAVEAERASVEKYLAGQSDQQLIRMYLDAVRRGIHPT